MTTLYNEQAVTGHVFSIAIISPNIACNASISDEIKVALYSEGTAQFAAAFLPNGSAFFLLLTLYDV